MKIEIFFYIAALMLFSTCRNSARQDEKMAENYEDSLEVARELEKEKVKIKFPAYIYLDNPTSSPIVFQVANKKDTLPPFIYEKQEIESGNNKLVIFNAEGEVETDTAFFTDSGQDILLNLSYSNYYVLMLQYKQFDFADLKTPKEMLMDEVLNRKAKEVQHQYPEPNPAGDQHRAYEKSVYKRPSTTTKNYEITQYYMFTKIKNNELIIPKYWDLEPTGYFKGSENLKAETNDAYLRQLVREKDLEIKEYFGSGETGRYKSGDEISAIFNIKYINSLVQAVNMIKSYDKNVIEEIKGSCKECEEFFNTINSLSAKTSSTKGLRTLSADFNKLLKKYTLKNPWLYCNSKSEKLVKKYFYKEHIEHINSTIRENLY